MPMPGTIRILVAATAATAAFAGAAPAQQHWAFVPPVAVVPAPADAAHWCRDDLDRCALAAMQAQGLRPSPAADAATLLRRVHLVLTGLPPTAAEVADFVADDSPDAYERRVDALLASDACAEHLATGWLDLARFADTYGYQADFVCRTWPWRDWLIQALRADLPWNRFVEQIVAGDLLPDADVQSRTATAFWRLHRQTNEGGSIDEEWRNEYVADRVDTFGAAFLGLTVGCARCHDHKTDPITQRDYYALGGFFDVDEAGTYPYSTGVTPQPAMRLTTAEQDAEIARLQAAVDGAAAAARAAGEPAASVEPVLTRPDELACDGDTRTPVDGAPAFTRDDRFRVRVALWCPDHKDRAVVLHTSQYTIESDAQGYQLLIEDGRLSWQLVHHWPGSAIAVRTVAALPLQRWVELELAYDGSSRASGLTVTLDGARVATEVVRDELQGPAVVRRLELGGRDRDRGFAGGRIRGLAVFDDSREAGTAHEALRAARKALHAYVEGLPELMVMASNPHPRPRFVLRRGRYDDPDRAQPVAADVPAAILPFEAAWPHDRRGLARWLLDPRNPLPARVAVDRLWALCFGRGLVPSPDNFGRAAEAPVQQPLLDLLACDFQAHGSMRALLRRIVGSATFRQSSAVGEPQRDADPENQWLARGPAFRLSAEALRDQALFASGLLCRDVGGPSVKPWQPPGLWRDAGVGWGGADYKPDTGPAAHRRSLYTFRKRTAPPPDLLVFDAPTRETCVVRRQVTDTPLQALVAWNDPVFTECAKALAVRAVQELPDAAECEQLAFVFAQLAARPPRPAEAAALATLAAAARESGQSLVLVASTLMASDAVVMVR